MKESKKNNQGREEILEHAIINHMAEAMFVTDLSGNIIIINEIAKETLGYDIEDDLFGKNVFTFIEWRDKNGEKVGIENNPVTRVIKSKEMLRITFSDGWSGVRKDGKAFPVRVYVSPVKLMNKVKAIVVVFHDATRERRIDEIKSDFISVASHQLRTPLAVSTLHAEMLLAGHAGELGEEQKEYIKEIQLYNKKMADLLNVFLSVSKIEMDTFTTSNEPLDVNEILEEVVRETGVEIIDKDIELSKQYFVKLPKVVGDRELLRASFQNILSNAVKYSNSKGKVFVETKISGTNVLVKIKDSGLGIPESDKSRVFMKLYRGKNVRKIDSKGTGLGLYIAKSFIEKMNGQIWFDSEENAGTTFFISLPVEVKKLSKNHLL
jgi:two-component system sensor histidine kinase VicK